MLVAAWDTATGELSFALARSGPVPPGGQEGAGPQGGPAAGDGAGPQAARDAGAAKEAAAWARAAGLEILFRARGEGGAAHSGVLPPLAARALAEGGHEPSDLGLVCAGRGPGSFTGLRTGLAFAKGLAMGARCPAVGVPTLEALAAAVALPAGILAPVLDARRGEVFTALYLTAERPLEAPEGGPKPAGAGIAKAPGGLPAPLPLAPPAPPRALTGILALAPAAFHETLAGILRDLGRQVPPLPEGPCLTLGPGSPLLPSPPDGFRAGPEEGPDSAVVARLGLWRFLSRGDGPNPPLPLYGRSPEIFKTWRPPVRLAAREALEGA
ncbi:MAG: tRNA (adenosine(37)-N6)-threonylcarbamoyltransferase complex dimerization subunit type 1 TsaB [Deltaproteobacteria bacterium]|jgi:tRNA threonylcarbamoyl adenosine modification protein YeaZ|nr:tRNA (adenosine(37)-N6)-threonylcarbamoyltransferase complex dimerization subunit type 1 TsaB [Deltaproteobacteria bacterium]